MIFQNIKNFKEEDKKLMLTLSVLHVCPCACSPPPSVSLLKKCVCSCVHSLSYAHSQLHSLTPEGLALFLCLTSSHLRNIGICRGLDFVSLCLFLPVLYCSCRLTPSLCRCFTSMYISVPFKNSFHT